MEGWRDLPAWGPQQESDEWEAGLGPLGRWADRLLLRGLQSSAPFQGTSPRGIATAPQKEVCLGGKHPDLGARRPGSLPQSPGRFFIPETGSQFHLMWPPVWNL